MSIYEHKQGSYESYRVARSVDGKLRQEYFPKTRKGLAAARKRDKELASEQENAQQFFTGPALRWQKKPKRVTTSTTSKSKRVSTGSKRRTASTQSVSKPKVRSKSSSTTKRRASNSTAKVKTTRNASRPAAKRVDRAKRTAQPTSSRVRQRKSKS